MDNPATTAGLPGRGIVIGDGPGQVTDAQATTRLAEAWRALQREMSRLGVNLEQQIASEALAEADVADVVYAAAVRVLRNPEGYVEESGAIDDWRESGKRADASTDLYFTAAELRRLSPTDSAGAASAGSFKYC